MPAKSAKQYRFMQMIAHSPRMSSLDPPKSVAKEFIRETPAKKRRLFSKKASR